MKISPILLSAVIAWAIAQFLKILIAIFQQKKFDFKLMWASGGMPSSHSATVCAMTACCAYLEGFSSNAFAIACVFAFVVMYDAMGVRRAVGEQAKALNQIILDIANSKPFAFENGLKVVMGHTPLQVLFGALLGILVGCLFPWLLNIPSYIHAA